MSRFTAYHQEVWCVHTEKYLIIRRYCLYIQKSTSSSGGIVFIYRNIPHHQVVLSVHKEKYLSIRRYFLYIQKDTSSSGGIVCTYRKVPHHQEVLSLYTERYIIISRYFSVYTQKYLLKMSYKPVRNIERLIT